MREESRVGRRVGWFEARGLSVSIRRRFPGVRR